MTGTCLCGSVSVMIEAKPEFIHDCNCSLCRKSGGAWGYFPSAMVTTTGKTIAFLRSDKKNAAAQIQFCETCGTSTHWDFTEAFKEENASVDLMGVNMRMFEPDELKGVEVRFPNGKEWSGEGPFDYRRYALTIGDRELW